MSKPAARPFNFWGFITTVWYTLIGFAFLVGVPIAGTLYGIHRYDSSQQGHYRPVARGQVIDAQKKGERWTFRFEGGASFSLSEEPGKPLPADGAQGYMCEHGCFHTLDELKTHTEEDF